MSGRILYFVLTLQVITSSCASQNLIPNPSFELYTACPSHQNELYKVVNWFNPIPAVNLGSTPDYFNTCAIIGLSPPGIGGGFQYPHSGNAYIGLALYDTNSFQLYNEREYAEAQLIDTLEGGKKYHFEMYINRLETFNYSISRIGAFFTSLDSLPVMTTSWLNVQPQIESPLLTLFNDTVNWVKIDGDFIATGGEKYVYIGNFRNDSNTFRSSYNNNNYSDEAYYLFDDLSLTRVDSTQGIGNDINIKDIALASEIITTTIDFKGLEGRSISKFEIFNSFGQLTFNSYENNGNNINVSFLNSGIYLIRMEVENKLYVYKFFKWN